MPKLLMKTKLVIEKKLRKWVVKLTKNLLSFMKILWKWLIKMHQLKKLVTEELKGYLCHKTITSQTVSSEVQVKILFFFRKVIFHSLENFTNPLNNLWTILWRTGANFHNLFNLAVCSNYSIPTYVKIPVFHLQLKMVMSTVKNGQILLYCHLVKS